LEEKIKSFVRDYNCLLLCAAIILLSAVFIPGFVEPLNLFNVIVEASIIGILAIGMTFLLLLGLFDMSMGMQVSLCSLVAAFTAGFGIVPCIIITLAVGLAVGAFNGVVTSKYKINAFIATFAMTGILQGITLVISDGKSIYISRPDFNAIYSASVFGIPLCIVIFTILAVLAQFWLRYTKKGFEIYVCGGNREAAALSGVNTFAVNMLCFMVSSFCAGVVAILMASRINSASPTLGSNYTLLVITACIVGGVKFSGGYGNIVNAFLGVLAMQLINNVMYMTNTYGFIQTLINGFILLMVLGIDAFTGKVVKIGKLKNVKGW
jgi:ribose transport system permease protein